MTAKKAKKKQTVKDRVDKAPDRIKKLFKSYPVVAGAMLAIGMVIGFVLGKVL